MKLFRSWPGMLALIIALAATGFAQDKAATASAEAKGAITGTVSDQKGAGVSGATVKVTSSAGAAQSATTDDQGLYAVTDLAAGAYDFSVTTKEGIKVFEANINISPGQVLTLGVSGAPVAQTIPAPGTTTTTPATAGATGTANPAVPPAPAEAGLPTPAQAPATPQAAPGTPGSIGGAVNDSTGAVVVGANIKVTNTAGLTKNIVADEKGNYSAKDLPPGTYTVAVAAPGFKAFEAPGITLHPGQDLPLDAVLEPAAEKTEVNVEGQKVAQVETENAEVSGTITQKEVASLQLNGRNFTQLIALAPGVSNQTGQDEAKVGVQGSVKYSVNGGRVEYNSFEVDGSDVLNAGLVGAESTLVVYPSLDAIQELKVLTSNYGAQYGRTASGSVQVTTKSGGSKWHGGGYEFFRNEFFNSRNYFDPPGKAPEYRRNDFGFNIGGPLTIPGHYNVNKDKTFVFFSEEFRIEKSPSELQPDFNRAVPTAAERQGNFSDVCPNPNDPQDLGKLFSGGQQGLYYFPVATYPDCPRVALSGAPPGYGQMFYAVQPSGTITYNNLSLGSNINGSIVPGSGLDPNALAILHQNLIPLPNSYTGCDSSLVGKVDHTTGQLIAPCYNAVISEPTYWREELFRIDHNFSPKTTLSLRYIHDAWNTQTPIPNWGTVTNTLPTIQNKFVGPGIDVVARLTETLSPSLLNQTVISFTNQHITLADVNGPGGANYLRPAGLGNPADVGQCTTGSNGVADCPMGYIFNNGFGGKVPGLVVGGDNQEYGGTGFAVDPSYMPWEHTNPTYSISDDVSKALGKHFFQFGAQYVLAQKNETNGALEAASGDVQGLIRVSNVNGGITDTGNAFANFLFNDGNGSITGGGNAVQSYTQDSTQLRYYNRYQIAEPFVQDDWKVTSRFTLNLGLRISLFGNFHENYLRAYNWEPQLWSPSVASQLSVDPTTGQVISLPGTTPIPINLSNLDPRLTNGLVQCGVGYNGVPAGCVKEHVFNPAPRIGFAWDPKGDGKTSIRAGYGIFFEHGTGDEANTGSLEGSAPLVLSMTQPFPESYACIGNYGTNCNAFGNGVSQPGAFPLNLTSIPQNTPYSYSQQWSLSIQREIPHDFVATFAYVGSKGTHLTVERQLNQLAPVAPQNNPFAANEPIIISTAAGPGDCSNRNTLTDPVFILQNGTTVSAQNPASVNLQIACQGESQTNYIPLTNTFRPYPGIGEIFSLQNVADSHYNAFQTTLRRTKGPLTAGVAYTFSHSIDDASDRTDPTFVNSLDLRSNKASSNFDQRHLLNISYIYSVPKLSSLLTESSSASDEEGTTPMPATASRFAQWVGDNWQWSGITVYQSGTPFSVINNAGVSGIGVLDNAGVANGVGAGSYPDVIPHFSGAMPAAGNNASSFGPLLLNPDQFVAPRGLTFGDAGRNYLNNPGRLNFDMSLLKHFPMKKEGSEFEFRVEAFNVFNHTEFRIYNPDLGYTGSNSISCYGGANYSASAYFPGGTDCLTGNSFLHPVDAHRPRTMQLGLKYTF